MLVERGTFRNLSNLFLNLEFEQIRLYKFLKKQLIIACTCQIQSLLKGMLPFYIIHIEVHTLTRDPLGRHGSDSR
jgi:hypothetical protein